MAEKGKYVTYKDKGPKGGAVTVVRRGSKYDDGGDLDIFTGASASAAAETIGKSAKKKDGLGPSGTAEVMRKMSKNRRTENAAKGKGRDFKFFEHKTKGK